MKLCFSTLGCTEMDLASILDLANKYHIFALELRGIGGVMDNRRIEALDVAHTEETQAMFANSKVSPRVLGTSCSFHNIEKYEAAIEEGKACVEIAARLHIPYIRVFGNNVTGETDEERETCIARVIAGIREICEYASNTEVTVLLEVHGDYNKVETLQPITDALGFHPHFGLIWDIAHTHAYGAQWPLFYQAFRPYIRHIHIKDRANESGKLTLPGEGDLPILPIVRTLISDGFDGYFSLEWEKKWHPELPEIAAALTCYTALMEQV